MRSENEIIEEIEEMKKDIENYKSQLRLPKSLRNNYWEDINYQNEIDELEHKMWALKWVLCEVCDIRL